MISDSIRYSIVEKNKHLERELEDVTIKNKILQDDLQKMRVRYFETEETVQQVVEEKETCYKQMQELWILKKQADNQKRIYEEQIINLSNLAQSNNFER